jgi:hypothetical protein
MIYIVVKGLVYPPAKGRVMCSVSFQTSISGVNPVRQAFYTTDSKDGASETEAPSGVITD